MAWVNPKTDWTPVDGVTSDDFNRIEGNIVELDKHTKNEQNPHKTTKSQVGLGSVENLALATRAQAEAGSSNTAYMTPLSTRQAIERMMFKKRWSGIDAEDVFTVVEYRRMADDTLAARAVLSGGTSPRYTTRTITFYGMDGVTVEGTLEIPLSYDSDGNLIEGA